MAFGGVINAQVGNNGGTATPPPDKECWWCNEHICKCVLVDEVTGCNKYGRDNSGYIGLVGKGFKEGVVVDGQSAKGQCSNPDLNDTCCADRWSSTTRTTMLGY